MSSSHARDFKLAPGWDEQALGGRFTIESMLSGTKPIQNPLVRPCFLQSRGEGRCSRILGAHLYGPYFNADKVGCHPLAPARPPTKSEYGEYLRFAHTILVATCAPELPGASDFFRDAAAAGIRLNAGHSNASWSEVQMAFDPMSGGVML